MRNRFAIGLIILTAGLLLASCGARETDALPHGMGLFSWKEDVLQGKDRERLFRHMSELELSRLYQAIPEDTDADVVKKFALQAAEEGIDVYLLTGDPAWALDSSGSAMDKEVQRASEYNKKLPQRARLQGVIMDTEPYLTEEWEEQQQETMDSFVEAMKSAGKQARAAGMEYIACIPYYYDSQGLEEALIQLIRSGCDGLAIMNYNKEHEALHIERELELAEENEIPVTVIYELQAPGNHGLKEKNTYYNQGLSGVADSIEHLEEAFKEKRISYALHDYTALQEVMKHE